MPQLAEHNMVPTTDNIKTGFVYVAASNEPNFEGLHKIGFTTCDVNERLSAAGAQSGNTALFAVNQYGPFSTEFGQLMERTLCDFFSTGRASKPLSEWLAVSADVIAEAVILIQTNELENSRYDPATKSIELNG